MSDTNTTFDLDSLLDSTLDDLEDLPEFKPFPPGAHKVLMSLELKDINGKHAVEMSMKMIETLELSEPTKDTAPEAGTVANIMFMLDNEYGRGNMKRLLRPVAEHLGTSTNRELIEQAKDIEIAIVTGYRKNKEDPTSPFMAVKELAVV